MKRGDIIVKDEILPIGTIVLRCCSSEDNARNYMENTFLQKNNILPQYKLEEENVILLQPITTNQEAKVNWVIDGDIAIQFKDGTYKILEEEESKEWRVTVESVPSYQSSVEHLSNEELRLAIDNLREKRAYIPVKVKKTDFKKESVDKNDPTANALASLSPEVKLELMKKLGMVD